MTVKDHLEALRVTLDTLVATLARALDEVVPPPRRPIDLVRQIGIDKTLASRVVKLAESAQPLRMLKESPGPSGLRMVADALEKRGVAAELLCRLRDLVHALERQLAEFPEGKTGLDAAIAASFDASRVDIERAARQSVFKAMSLLIGCRLESAYHVYVVTPSVRGDRLDEVYIQQRAGFRRLRPGGRTIVAGIPSIHAADVTEARVVLLDGTAMSNDRLHTIGPEAIIVKEFSSHPLPTMIAKHQGTAVHLALDEGVPSPGAELTVTTGVKLVASTPRWSSPDRMYDSFGVTMRKPVRTLVMDVLLHESVGIPSPIVTMHVSGSPPSNEPRQDEYDPIDLPCQVMSMGRGIDRLATRAVPQARAIAERAIAVSGFSPEAMLAYRLIVEYPIPGMTTRLWLKLPSQEMAS